MNNEILNLISEKLRLENELVQVKCALNELVNEEAKKIAKYKVSEVVSYEFDNNALYKITNICGNVVNNDPRIKVVYGCVRLNKNGQPDKRCTSAKRIFEHNLYE